jgi:hypothetical protein
MSGKTFIAEAIQKNPVPSPYEAGLFHSTRERILSISCFEKSLCRGDRRITTATQDIKRDLRFAAALRYRSQ